MSFSFTNAEIDETAKRQSAIDLGCTPEAFDGEGETVVLSRADPAARRYLTLPFLCNIVWYGGGVVASVSAEHEAFVRRYIRRFPPEHLFETPAMHVLNDYFERHDARVCFMAEYFLPDMTRLRELPCGYETRLLEKGAFENLYVPQWSNALCEKRRELDVLAVGAYDAGGQLIGLAGCSADCDTMWQIGIDVLPPYRRQGIASALTSRLAMETLRRGKAPFYCAAWSNIRSVRSALRSGFRPAWVEMTVKSRAFTDEMNGDFLK